jgi:hypothetical protein
VVVTPPRAAGALWYEPAALAQHRIPVDRLDWGWLRRRFWQGGFGQALVDRRAGVPIPPLPDRLVRALRTTQGARALRRRNAGRADLGPEEVLAEFSAYLWASRHVELLLGRYPRQAAWLAAHAV